MSSGWSGLVSRLRESGTTSESTSSPESRFSVELQPQKQEGAIDEPLIGQRFHIDGNNARSSLNPNPNRNSIANADTIPPQRKKSIRNVLQQWSDMVHDKKLRQQLQEDDIKLEFLRKRYAEGHSISKHGRPRTYIFLCFGSVFLISKLFERKIFIVLFHRSWRQKMFHYIHSRPVQILIATLILIDVGLLIGTLFV